MVISAKSYDRRQRTSNAYAFSPDLADVSDFLIITHLDYFFLSLNYLGFFDGFIRIIEYYPNNPWIVFSSGFFSMHQPNSRKFQIISVIRG